jgi:hypothetical protein
LIGPAEGGLGETPRGREEEGSVVVSEGIAAAAAAAEGGGEVGEFFEFLRCESECESVRLLVVEEVKVLGKMVQGSAGAATEAVVVSPS